MEWACTERGVFVDRKRFIKLSSFLFVSILVLYIGYLVVFPITHSTNDITNYIEKKSNLSNVVILDESDFSTNHFIGGAFVLFSYGDGSTYGKASFTSLSNRLKIKNIYTNAQPTDVHVLKVNKIYYRIFGFLNSNGLYSKVKIRDGAKEELIEVPISNSLLSYPILKTEIDSTIQLEFLDANGLPVAK